MPNEILFFSLTMLRCIMQKPFKIFLTLCTLFTAQYNVLPSTHRSRNRLQPQSNFPCGIYCINCVKFNINIYRTVFFFRHNIGVFYVKTALMLTMLLLKNRPTLLYMIRLTLQRMHGKTLRQIQLFVVGTGLIFFRLHCQQETILILHPRKEN